VTGQLEHPSIVSVYELGLDEADRVYYTMQLVEGETLARVFERARNGTDGWTREEAEAERAGEGGGVGVVRMGPE